jgi:hypothetical protein
MANYIPRPTPLPSNRSVRQHFSMLQVYEAWLFHLNKVSAPSKDIDTFNEFWEMATSLYYQKRYNIYDTSQQTTDDLRELSATRVYSASTTPVLEIKQERVPLPEDYWHTLSVQVFWQVVADFKTLREGEVVNFAAERLSADRLSAIRADHYNRPSYKKPGFLVRDQYMEVHAGIHVNLKLFKVDFTYLMLPEQAVLRDTDLDDSTADTSQVLKQRSEVTREILKECVTLTLENDGNPRLQSQIPVQKSVPEQPPMPAAPAGRRS